MTEFGLTSQVVVPIGLGLLGFIEPCSIGSTLIFIKYLEGEGAAAKLAEVSVFAITRAVFIGLLGVLAVLLGTAFLGLQKAAWIFLGGIYFSLGILYLVGKAGLLMVSLGPSIVRLSGARGPAAFAASTSRPAQGH